jgi:hypothetical protein
MIDRHVVEELDFSIVDQSVETEFYDLLDSFPLLLGLKLRLHISVRMSYNSLEALNFLVVFFGRTQLGDRESLNKRHDPDASSHFVQFLQKFLVCIY